MRTFLHRLIVVLLACAAALLCSAGEDERPNYDELRLQSVFPAGAQRGTTVQVEFRTTSSGVFEAKQILVDGPAGVTVRDLRQDRSGIFATLDIAADAVPGRRGLRVLGERVGLTNMIYFSVGTLPEVIELAEKSGQEISIPCVVNGTINPEADVDVYRFAAHAGQRLAAFAAAQAIDSHGQYKDYGYTDLNLQVLDSRGQTIAAAQDTIGLDPLVEFVAAEDGTYTVHVDHVVYRGFPQAVYRLIVGDVPMATSVFPPGMQRGVSATVSLNGPFIPVGTTLTVSSPEHEALPWGFVSHPESAGDVEVPIVYGDLPESTESEPNSSRDQANQLALSSTVNGRFELPGDEDWFRMTLAASQKIEISTIAQQFLRSPVDTSLEVYDSGGQKLAENDDGFPIEYMSVHDFEPPDSRLTWTAPADGDYWIRVFEQSGTSGPRAVYRMTVKPAVPDFELLMYPDAVPVWGPGSTAGFVVKVNRFHGLMSDIELSIEGLPEGWTGSRSVNIVQTPDRPPSNWYNYFGLRNFLTITAPPDSKPADLAGFRVVGRARHEERLIEHQAQPLTWYYTSDIGFFRMTQTARAVVAAPRRPWLTTSTTELTGSPGDKLEAMVQIHEGDDLTSLVLVPNLTTAGVACGYNAPGSVSISGGLAIVPITITPETPVGDYWLTISRSWGSDIRVGMPGPCTPLIKLHVVPPKQP